MLCQGEEMNAMAFRILTTEEIRKISVIELITPNTFDSLDHPLKNGLYDLTMGPSGCQSEECLTCKQTVKLCPGHFGHIDFPVPLVNPFFKSDVGFLLKYMCKSCYRFIYPTRLKNLFQYQLKLINAGYVTEAQELFGIISDIDGAGTNEAIDILNEEKLSEFIKSKNLQLDRDVKPTKTSEALRKEFIDFHMKRISSIKLCPHCKSRVWWIATIQGQHFAPFGKLDADPNVKTININTGGKKGVPVLPGKSQQMLRNLWENESEFIETLMPILKHRPENASCGTDLFYMNAMLVPPPKVRPMTKLDGKLTEHQQSRLFKDVIMSNIVAKYVVKAARDNTCDNMPDEAKSLINDVVGDNFAQKLHQCWKELQRSVDILLSTSKKAPVGMMGLKELIEKKEGTLRKHMMGKRVNFAARSVITPDPNLLVQEIGVPLYFATRLTYPVKANFFNINELKEMVKNGPDEYPGATHVEDDQGNVIRLFPGEEFKNRRAAIAKRLLRSVEAGTGKIVHRHLKNGDMLLMNRQPTLHRPSIMAHSARILKGEKTFRMHYSNCKSYNADFDGDEMNAHCPQNELARSEAYNLMCVKDHYLVPKDGTPLGGLIQDHVISGVRLTIRGQFFTREEYYQLVYQALSYSKGDLKLLPPSILKPKMMWSGKQIISTVLINIIPENKPPISLCSKAKINANSWCSERRRKWKCGKEFKKEDEMSESQVIVQNGHLVCGVLDKQHYGATPFGLTHCLYELYGGSCSSKFLNSVGKLFTVYLQWNGFTLGIKDILINEKEDEQRSKIIEKLKDVGYVAAKNALELDEIPPDLEDRLQKAFYEDKVRFKGKLDQEYKKILDNFTNDINSVCLPRGLVAKFPENNLQLMVTSGAKGSTVNTMQISCLLGQIELEGKRPPLMISGRSLPSFKPFDISPRAGGYVDGRFMTGITPQDFFFHCMAGREGLIDTAVKTSRSGYLQRCLIKHLEGVVVCYDGTVRDHDGSIIQYAYGEDGLEVQQSTFLNKNQMEFLYRNKNSIIDDSAVQMLINTTDLKMIEKHKKRIRAWDDELKEDKWRKSSYNGFALFSAHIRNDVAEKHWMKLNRTTGRCKALKKVIKKWNELDDKGKNAYKSVRPDPLITKFNRNTDFGVITEKLEALVEEYLASRPNRQQKFEKTIRKLINIKYMSSLCQPGESVGLLAAQSIGEPSTQMTLNTFHFAGRGEMNVTLGIPRLREILMTATKNIKTPYMDIPLKKSKSGKMEKRGKRLRKMFQMVTLADVLETIEVREKLVTSPSMLLTYTMRFNFLPYKSYKHVFSTSPHDILRYMEKEFLIALCKQIRSLGKKYGDLISESKQEKTLSKVENDEEEVDNKEITENDRKRSDSVSSSEDEVDDGDATATRLRQRHQDGREYDSGESEEDESEEEVDDPGEPEMNGDGDLKESAVEETESVLSAEKLINISDRENFVLTTFPMVKTYKFDVVKEEWCEMVFGIPVTLSHIDFSSILRDICEKCVIYQVPNVKRAILYKNKEGNLSIKTEGINLIELFKYRKLLDLNRLYSNDIHEIARVYGIEAAARVVVNELKEVFGVYGITVDPRHLLLIADYMTHQGVFLPFNRNSMSFNPSPFQQMTFESTVKFLKDAILENKMESLTSPSSRIMTGKYCSVGTGCFDLISEGVYGISKKHQSNEISGFL